jgi:Mg2+ and Co2+ transporter CorA
MLQTYRIHRGRLEPGDIGATDAGTPAHFWLDLRDPTAAKRSQVEQNRGLTLPGIKDARSIEALLFLPPMLIGSVYSLNFHFMPEPAVPWAYHLTLPAMPASSIVPCLICKRRRRL